MPEKKDEGIYYVGDIVVRNPDPEADEADRRGDERTQREVDDAVERERAEKG